MKVLIGVDGSDGSFEAVRQLGHLLSGDQDQVALYYTPPEVKVHADAESAAQMQERARAALAQAVFEEAQSHLPASLASDVHTIEGTQNPRHGLIVAADEWRADMLAVGARGIGGFQRLLLGSVSTSIAHGAGIPVYVARANPSHTLGAGPKVLLASDDTESSQQAVEFLARFTWPAGAEGRVISVVESMFAAELPQWLEKKARDGEIEAMAQAWVREHETEKEQRREAMKSLCDRLPKTFAASEPLVAEGTPSDEILRAIDAEKSDLCVVGARGLGLWNRLLLGSTSEKVLQRATCSVLVVRQHEKP